MGKSITIRDVPDGTSAELSARAAATGRSLQEYLRSELIKLADGVDVDVWLARLEARQAVTGGSISTEEILRHRDEGRR